MDLTLNDAKTAARALRRRLAATDISISHSRALEIVSQQLGFTDWNTASAMLHTSPAGTGPAVPVLRIHDETLARQFYLDYLGFTVEWEHRFEPDMPLYVRIRRDQTVLDLSEHHGDGTPGTTVWVPVADVSAFQADISRRPHPASDPASTTMPPEVPRPPSPIPSGTCCVSAKPGPSGSAGHRDDSSLGMVADVTPPRQPRQRSAPHLA